MICFEGARQFPKNRIWPNDRVVDHVRVRGTFELSRLEDIGGGFNGRGSSGNITITVQA